ncbi:MAG: polysaccharide biosynthesis protein, partial [Flavobacteriales bacterium]|nr:polysaccharide biosynthesis protein [Flavobacteriales bacterium]
VAPNVEYKIVGIRPGEKVHEEMITHSDSFYTYDLGSYYAILPTIPKWNLDEYIQAFNAKKVTQGFRYNSNENDAWETPESLRELIKIHVDPDFEV